MDFSLRYPGDDAAALRAAGHTLWARLPYALRLLSWYWRSAASRRAWAMLALMLLAVFGSVKLAVWINAWERDWTDALVSRNFALAMHLTLVFLGLIVVNVAVFVARPILEAFIGFRWRDWMTQRYLDKWLHGLAYYRLESRGTVDNPDQRIAQDLAQFSELSLRLVTGFVSFVGGTVSFGIVLWGLSGTAVLPLGDMQLAVPGYLVFAAVLYALVGSWLVTFSGRNLVAATVRQERYEADFRFLLIHIRRGAEQLALYRGEGVERARLSDAFGWIRANFRTKLLLQTRVAAAQSVYLQLDTLVPLLLVLPRYFAGSLTLGMVLQARGAFIGFGSAMSWFAQQYPTFLALRATVLRIHALELEMDVPAAGGLQRAEWPLAAVSMRALTLCLPGGTPLVTVGDADIGTGERWLVRGPSGVGKSTLLRAMAGLWTAGAGRVQVPFGTMAMFVPQRAYFPVGTLKDALAFPQAAAAIDDAACLAMLHRCGLGHLTPRLGELAAWERELSGGEQQRLAFGRAMLCAPQVLFLDEASSALDAESERALHVELLRALPGVTLVSVAHREALAVHHTHALDLRPDGAAVACRLPAAREPQAAAPATNH